MATNLNRVFSENQMATYLSDAVNSFTKKNPLIGFSSTYGMYESTLIPYASNYAWEIGTTGLLNIPPYHEDVLLGVEDILSNMLITIEHYNRKPSTGSNLKDLNLRAGDLLRAQRFETRGGGKTDYIVLVTKVDDDRVRTFPALASDAVDSIITYQKFKLDYNKLSAETKDVITTVAGIQYEYVSNDALKSTIKKQPRLAIKGLLKIGDINFLVSPTQLSFNTQNGYQYFPTIRTTGNPKIPSAQESKDISLTLIFPNANAINYQLLPLFAMFKRAPFVNIYNKDISNFFHEIKDESDYVAVVLANINIQSIQGFPNSLQANITMMPFQREAIGSSFKALKTFDDIKFIQDSKVFESELLSTINNYNSRLVNSKRSFEATLVRPNAIEPTSDFSLSEPFRTYYRGLLDYTNFVLDENGDYVRRTDGSAISTTSFKPKKKSNSIKAYIGAHNNKPMSFTYNYIDNTIRGAVKDLQIDRRNAIITVSDSLRGTYELLKDNDIVTFKEQFTTTILNRRSFFDSLATELSFNSFNSFITDKLASYDINVETPAVKDITSTTELLFRLATFKLHADLITPDVIISTNKLIKSNNITSTTQTKDEVDYKVGMQDRKNIAITQGITLFDPNLNKQVTAQSYETDIYTKLQKHFSECNDKEKLAYAAMFDGIFNTLASGGEQIDLNTLQVKNLNNMATEIITIDNINDVITGWGISFANKLIPIQLSGYKYPFYQHLGSDDMSISLSIMSLQNGRKIGLKENLSMLNDRLQNSTKIILMNMPELINFYDKNLSVSGIKDGHMFNVFGLKNVVYNNSSITAVQGQPDAWSISLSLTQDQLTLQEYQSITQVETTYGFEDDIANLICRTRFDLTTNEHKATVYDIEFNSTYIGTSLDTFLKKLDGDDTMVSQNEALDNIIKSYFPGITMSTFQDIADQLKKNDTSNVVSNNYNITSSIEKTVTNRMFLNIRASEAIAEMLDIKIADTTNGIDSSTYSFTKTVQKIYVAGTTVSNAAIDAAVIKELARMAGEGALITKKLEASVKATMTKSIIGSEYGVEEVVRHGDLKNELTTNFFTLVPNKHETDLLNAKLDVNPAFRATFRHIITKTNSLLDLHADFITERLLEEKDLNVWKSIVGLTLLQTGAAAVPLAFTPWTAVTIPIVAAGFLVYNSADYFIRSSSQDLRNLLKANSRSIESMFERIINGYVSQLSHVLARDPMALKNIISDTIYNKVIATYNKFGLNCYKDFDVNHEKVDVLGGDKLIFSPDFYLYNPTNANSNKRNEFIREALISKATNAEIQANLVLQGYKDATKMLISNLNIFDDDDNYITKIKSDLNFSTNANLSISDIGKLEDQDIDQIVINLMKTYNDVIKEFSGYKNTNGEISYGVDLDARKFNMMQVVRIQKVLELGIIDKTINATIDSTDKNTTSSDKVKVATDELMSSFSLDGLAIASMAKYRKYISNYFAQFLSIDQISNMTEASISNKTNSVKEIQKKLEKQRKDDEEGNTDSKNNKLFMPNLKNGSITNFEIQIYTRLHQLYILDSAIYEATLNRGTNIDLSSLSDIPQMQLLKWYGYRDAEQDMNDIRIIRQANKSNINHESSGTSKLFPTQKIYFVEEDNKKIRQLDDYYTADAIQSVDVVMNKYSAGRTAVIRLANTFNNLSDKISLMSENFNTNKDRSINGDNIFLGTLDVKPGTKMIIKQGYSANDKKLPIVFVGRIIEMKPGPVTEIVAQSYGTQLNHFVHELNFSFISSKNEHGDVAIAILDQMISSKGLGTFDPLEMNFQGFTGKNIGRLRENSFQKFLISNISSRTSASLLVQDNPRDVNIYLPFNLLSSMWDKITFDWKVQQQTVWQALGEISLYHNNTFPMVKLYNNDVTARLDDVRETVVIGDKSGYYKSTDAYALSSLKYKDIKDVTEEWNKHRTLFVQFVKDMIDNRVFVEHGDQVKNTPNDNWQLHDVVKGKRTNLVLNSDIRRDIWMGGAASSKATDAFNKYFNWENMDPSITGKKGIYKIDHNSNLLKLNSLVNNRYFTLMMVKLSIDTETAPVPNLASLVGNYLNKTGFSDEIQLGAMKTALAMSSTNGTLSTLFGVLSNTNTSATIASSFRSLAYRMLVIGYMFYKHDLKAIDYNIFNVDLSTDDFLDVKLLQTDNTDESLANDMQYESIQKHHVFSDFSDIISNNIVVSQSFNNAVKVTFDNEPKFSQDAGHSGKIPMVVKAFGATTDNDTRLLESFQRNIDPNYFETSQQMNDIFGDWSGTAGFDTDDPSLKKYSTWGFDPSSPTWDKLPASYKVALAILLREVETMYRGTLVLVGYPHIEPFDIIHLNDNLNNMVGTVEVEEVIHTFNPQQGFITTITPSMITYARNPIRMAEVDTMKHIVEEGLRLSRYSRNTAIAGTVIGVLATIAVGSGSVFTTGLSGGTMAIIGGVATVASAAHTVRSAYRIFAGHKVRYTNFLYDHFGNLFGRDCINFSALTYHNTPFMGGFGGVDYTNIKSMINKQSTTGPMTRQFATSQNTENAWIVSGGDLNRVGSFTQFMLGLGSADTGAFNGFSSWVVRAFFAGSGAWSPTNYNKMTLGDITENAYKGAR